MVKTINYLIGDKNMTLINNVRNLEILRNNKNNSLEAELEYLKGLKVLEIVAHHEVQNLRTKQETANKLEEVGLFNEACELLEKGEHSSHISLAKAFVDCLNNHCLKNISVDKLIEFLSFYVLEGDDDFFQLSHEELITEQIKRAYALGEIPCWPH